MSVANVSTLAFPAPTDFNLSPASVTYPVYHAHRPSYLPFLSDKYLSLAAPVVIYWVASLWFHFLDTRRFPLFEKYRIHESEEVTKRNRVSVAQVVQAVLCQHAVQTVLGVFWLENEEEVMKQIFRDHKGEMRGLGHTVATFALSALGPSAASKLLTSYGTAFTEWLYWWGIPIAQFLFAFFIMDAWQYFWHRLFHESRFLYRHFHSHHHRLYVPYAFGALYNHPVEGLILDSGGAMVAHFFSGMTIRQGIVLFAFSTLKTVNDHGGYALPWYLDPLQLIFPNTAEYHDVHHQMTGLRFNYSQPFFIHFDVLFGTRMSAEQARKIKDKSEKKLE